MQCLVQFICMICTYIYRYIYKVASKNGFLICNACSHSHSPTLHLFQRYSLFLCLSLSFNALFSFYSFIIKRVLEDERSSLSFFYLSKALSKVLCVNSLRYLQERLALQHLLPAVPSRCVIVREDPEDSGASYPEIATMYGISSGRPPRGLATIAYQHASGTPRCMNSFHFVCIHTRSAYRTVWCEPDTVSS